MKCLNDSIPVRITAMLTRQPTMIHTARNGVWSADLANGGTMFSSEKIDYHIGCREFLEGLREAGIPFTYYGTITL